MLFHSLEFFLFLPIVFTLYWSCSRSLKLQNVLVLAASYVFYGWWDWRFLGLIVASSCFDFVAGNAIAAASSTGRRRWLMVSSLCFNLGLLGIFKYFNFFANELQSALAQLGVQLDQFSLDIVLPVGISFYTFQTLSYTLDVHAGRMKPTRDPLAFFAFVAFFPQLVAGPIERARNLLPQFTSPRTFEYPVAVEGCRLILWGFVKKVLVADTAASLVDKIFAEYSTQSGWTLLVGVLLFAFQIYGDFSGYSDIARGVGKLLGFELMQNFALPYFSRSVAEFWRRWHISLSTWFRDYVFIPLGGSRGSRLGVASNVLIVFLVSGLWHGANWTFVAWGALNALFVLPVFVLPTSGRNRKPICGGRLVPTLGEAMQIAVTFSLICSTWILFRSPSIGEAWSYFARMIDQIVTYPGGFLVAFRRFRYEPAVLLALMMVVAEWASRWGEFSFDRVPRPLRWAGYQGVVATIIWFAFYRDPSEFIYFQF